MTFEVKMAIVTGPVGEGKVGEQGGAFLQSGENTKDEGVRRGGFSDGGREFKVESIDDDGVRNNGGISIVKGGVLGILARESTCGAHTRTWGDHPFNVKVLEKESPTSLTMGEFTRVFYIRKIFVVGNNRNRERGALKIMFPLRKSKNECEEFVVVDIIVAFSEGECFKEVSIRIQVTINIFLHENSACSEEGSISHDEKGARGVWNKENRGRGEDLTKVIEGTLLKSSPNPRFVFFGKEHKGGDNVGVIRDELLIEICEAKEGTNSFDGGGKFPYVNGRQFDWINFDQSIANDETKVFHGGVEGTFGKFDRKTVFMKALEDVVCLFVMEFEGTGGVETQVIHVDFKPAFGNHVGKNMVYEGLKGTGGIAESEEHDSWFKESERGDEHSFPLIFLMNMDVVVTPVNVEFSEVSGVLHVVNKLKDKR